MQKIADLGGGGGYFINVRNTHVCYMKYVTYWYQNFTCCEELVCILHSVKLTKCDRGAYNVLEINMGVCPRLGFDNITLINCLGYDFYIYDAYEFLCNSTVSL